MEPLRLSLNKPVILFSLRLGKAFTTIGQIVALKLATAH
jgi:hypothetical protein